MPLLPVTFPDVHDIVIDYLNAAIPYARAGVRVPEQRPDMFITVRRVGGVADGPIDRARVDFYAWALTDTDAHDLAQAIRTALASLPTLPTVARVTEFAGPIKADDISNQPRWLITYEVSVRGSAPT